MLGQASLPDERGFQADQVDLSKDSTSQKSTRVLWTGLGFAVLILLGVSACALQRLAPRASVEPSRLVPEVAFSPLPAVRSKRDHARSSAFGTAVLTATRPAAVPVMKKPTEWQPASQEEGDFTTDWQPGQPAEDDFGKYVDNDERVGSVDNDKMGAGDFNDLAEVLAAQDRLKYLQLKAQRLAQQKPLLHFGDEEFADLDLVRSRASAILRSFANTEALPSAEFRLIYDIIQRHPNRIEKRVDEVVSIVVRPSERFPEKQCFWILRSDGSSEDISIRKCFPIHLQEPYRHGGKRSRDKVYD